ncbi:SpoIIE family protein phosphatase [Streptomyces montanisoli]|uniref:SpoIIE family protein phosphatase n=1 Tax=Streptomyces montanisoli TaxID=2798581 RepID=A0A940MEC7_9ACTN|nr:SpoIIE family protein phosphatase [Streptomyces montanisoli]MBP0459482.1 SpoIIE family protein phosphatase [Streptomyces montanisoli]
MSGPTSASHDGGDAVPLAMAGVALLLVDGDGLVAGWAAGSENLLGHAVARAPGRPLTALVTASGSSGLPAAGPDGSLGLLTATASDGSARPLAAWQWPLHGTAGGMRLIAAVEAGTGTATPDEEASQVLARFFGRAPVGIAITGRDLRTVWANPAMERIVGTPSGASTGARLTEAAAAPGDAAEPIEALMAEVLETGRPALDRAYVLSAPSWPRPRRACSTCVFRLDDASGRPLGVCAMAVDTTGTWRSRERLELLGEAGTNAAGTLDVGATAQALAELCVPRLADSVAVDLLDDLDDLNDLGEPDDLGGRERRGGAAPGACVTRRVGHHGTPHGCAAGDPPVSHRAGTPYARCVAEGVTYLAPSAEAAPGSWLPLTTAWRLPPEPGPGDDEGPGAQRTCGVLLVPLRAGGGAIGVVTFVRDPRDLFVPDDLATVEAVAERIATHVGNAWRFAREHGTALALQRELLPDDLPAVSALDVTSRYVPATAEGGVGGDWFDMIPLSGARSALVVGDVVGHGVGAAAAMGRFRTAVRTLAAMELAPEEVLARLDDLVIGSGTTWPAAGDPGVGASCLYAVYDPVDRTCVAARAGHPPLALVAPDGTVTLPDLPPGPPLGLGGLPFASGRCTVRDGSVLALFTDGLLGAHGRDAQAGLDGLRAALAAPAPSLDALAASVLDALVEGVPRDDVALLLARAHGLRGDQVADWTFARDPAAAAAARTAATGQLHDWGLGHLEFTVELAVSELVTNAVRHASGQDVGLRMIHDTALVCEVADGAATAPRPRHARATDESGRGLFLVAQVARRWGTRFTPEGKVIWAEFDEEPG